MLESGTDQFRENIEGREHRVSINELLHFKLTNSTEYLTKTYNPYHSQPTPDCSL